MNILEVFAWTLIVFLGIAFVLSLFILSKKPKLKDKDTER